MIKETKAPSSIAPNGDVKDWSKLNNALYQMYLAAPTQDDEKMIEEKFIRLNEKMLGKKAASISITQYGAVIDPADVLQIVYTNYVEALRRFKEVGYVTYRLDIYKIVENTAKEQISNNYCAGGIKMPYGTKKRYVKEGKMVTPCMVSVNSCDEGDDATGIEKRKAAMMSNGESSENIVLDAIGRDIVRDGIKEALSMLDDVERDIVCMRYYHANKNEKVPWAEIGAKYGMTEGGARFKCDEALKKLRKICIQLELDACL